MSVLFTYAGLTRLYTVLPLALLAYAVGTAVGTPQPHVAAAAAAIACAVAGGFAYNDLRDQSHDRVNRPARPLVSGRLTNRQVRWVTACAFLGAVLFAAAMASRLTVAFILVLISCACLYSDVVKYILGLKNVFVGAWCGLLPWGAALDHAALETMLPSFAIVGLFITQKELVADVYDRDGDAAANVRTIPVCFGRRPALAIVFGLNALLWLAGRSAGSVPVLSSLAPVAQVGAIVNGLALCAVSLRPTDGAVRAYLELQKVYLIGGCIVLFALVMTR